MNRKAGFVLVLFVATVANIVITAVCFLVLFLLYMLLLAPRIPEETGFLGIPVIFVVAIIASFLIYQRLLKLYLKKRPLPKADQ